MLIYRDLNYYLDALFWEWNFTIPLSYKLRRSYRQHKRSLWMGINCLKCEGGAYTEKTRILFPVTEIRLYLLFCDWLGIERNSVWFRFNQEMENTIWFLLIKPESEKISLCIPHRENSQRIFLSIKWRVVPINMRNYVFVCWIEWNLIFLTI